MRIRSNKNPVLPGLSYSDRIKEAEGVVAELEGMEGRRPVPGLAIRALKSVPPGADVPLIVLVLRGDIVLYRKTMAGLRQQRGAPYWFVDAWQGQAEWK